MGIKSKNAIIWILTVIGLSFIQVLLREQFNFYAGDMFVSFLIGGWIGFITFPILQVKHKENNS